MNILHSIAEIGLILGVVGMGLLAAIVVPKQIREARDDGTKDRIVAILLPIAKISYIISFLPGLLYLTYRDITVPNFTVTADLFRISVGWGVLINCFSWLLIYTPIAKYLQKKVLLLWNLW